MNALGLFWTDWYLERLAAKRPLWVIESRLHSSVEFTWPSLALLGQSTYSHTFLLELISSYAGEYSDYLSKIDLGTNWHLSKTIVVLLTQGAPLARRPRRSRTLEIEWFDERMDDYRWN
jgi:hypothetical protein